MSFPVSSQANTHTECPCRLTRLLCTSQMRVYPGTFQGFAVRGGDPATAALRQEVCYKFRP